MRRGGLTSEGFHKQTTELALVEVRYYSFRQGLQNNPHAFSDQYEFNRDGKTLISSGLGISVTRIVLAAANTLLETAFLHRRLISCIPPISERDKRNRKVGNRKISHDLI
jgi:hypothetical protein